MKFTTTRHDEVSITRARFDAKRDIILQFAIETFFDVARGRVLTFLSGEWRGVDAKGHFHGWLFNLHDGKGFWLIEISDRFTDIQFWNAGEGDNVTRFGF